MSHQQTYGNRFLLFSSPEVLGNQTAMEARKICVLYVVTLLD